jgi:PAS domain S-box-containing protein
MNPSADRSLSPSNILDHMEDAVFAVAGDEALLYANLAAMHLFGLTDRAALPFAAKPFPIDRFEVADELDQPLVYDLLPPVRALRTRTRGEAVVRLRDRSTGDGRWYHVRSVPIVDSSGALDYVLTTLADATDRQRSVGELRVSHEWFSTTLESIGDAVIATDHEGRVNFMNEVAEELTGWSSAAARDAPLKDVFHIVNEQTRLDVESPVTKVLREGVVVGLANHTILIRRDGAELAIDDSGAPIRDASGNLVGVVLVFRDVTAKRREEERLLFLGEASAVLASSLDYATTLRTVAGLAVPRVADWCLVQVRDDDGAIRLLAHSHVHPAKGKWLFEIERLYPPDVAATEGVAAVLRTGRSELRERIGDDDLRAWARSDEHLEMLRRVGIRSRMIVPMRARDRTFGAIILGAAEASRPLSGEDLALAEQLARAAAIAIDNARLYAEAQEANRAKDEFLAILSHELRTPLNAILGWARMLRMGPSDAQRHERGLVIVERNARAQARLIDDLLDVSRIITGKLTLDVRSVDLPAVVEAAIDAMRPAADAKGVRLHLSLDRLLPSCSGDPQRLQQVASNLISNAVKFTPAGGEVSVDLHRIGSQIELHVRDTGQGIAPDFLPYVFDRFRQADASTTKIHMGMGLGLSIVKSLVEMHGGTVRAQSGGPKAGATFIVTLPMKSLSDDERYSLPPPMPLVSLKGTYLLVTDDDDDNRELLRVALEDAGAEVTAVCSAAEAMAAIAARPPDLLLSDIGMPGEDGYSLVRRLRALPPERGGRIPAIALTAHARPLDRAEALMAGFQEHVSKPIDPAELIVSVARFVAKPTSA